MQDAAPLSITVAAFPRDPADFAADGRIFKLNEDVFSLRDEKGGVFSWSPRWKQWIPEVRLALLVM